MTGTDSSIGKPRTTAGRYCMLYAPTPGSVSAARAQAQPWPAKLAGPMKSRTGVSGGVGGGGTPFLDTSLEEFRRVQRTNVEGAFLTLREAARPMVAQGTGGSLVGIASLAAIHGQPRGQSYAASKGGLISMIKAIAIELARHDIRANAVLPGWTMTPMAEPVLTWDRFREKVLPRMPVGRWGVPDDFGAVAVYLASPASAFHTADTLLLDGGYSAF